MIVAKKHWSRMPHKHTVVKRTHQRVEIPNCIIIREKRDILAYAYCLGKLTEIMVWPHNWRVAGEFLIRDQQFCPRFVCRHYVLNQLKLRHPFGIPHHHDRMFLTVRDRSGVLRKSRRFHSHMYLTTEKIQGCIQLTEPTVIQAKQSEVYRCLTIGR